MKLSAVVLTKNEEVNIKECLKTLSFCEEVVVVDDESTDKTVEIAKKTGAKVFKRKMNQDFSAQSNFGMKKATGKWVLFVDADERIDKNLALEIKSVIGHIGINGFFIKRHDFFLGKKLVFGDVFNTSFLRLVRKGSGKWVRRVHPGFEILGRTEKLKNPIRHHPHPSLQEFLSSINRWSSWHALALREEGKSAAVVKIILLPVIKFKYNYFLKLGFLDGIHGFVHAFFMSIHSFLAWGKLYFLQKERR